MTCGLMLWRQILLNLPKTLGFKFRKIYNMKKILLTLLVFSVSFIYGQETRLLNVLPFKDGKVIYAGVVRVDSVEKEQLYKRSKRWFVDTYKSAKAVIEIDDQENGEVIGKGYFKTLWDVDFLSSREVNVWHTIKLSVKDNRFRYEITDFRIRYHVLPNTFTSEEDIDVTIEDFGEGRKKNTKKFYAQVDAEVRALIVSIEKFMKSKAQEDW